MNKINIELTEDQAEDIIITYGNRFYDYKDKDNQYAHFCHRIRMTVSKARRLAKAKS